MSARPGRDDAAHSKNRSLVMEVSQRYFIKFIMEQGMKGVEIIDRLNKHSLGDTVQRTHVYYWMKEVKSGEKDFLNIHDRESRQIRDWMITLRRDSKRILIFQQERL
jgi:hypothetical protein